MTENPSKTKPIRDRRLSPRDWSISDVPERQCTAHRKKGGERCKNAAIRWSNVCGYHGGNAPAVKAKARLRLEMASDRLARQLLNMTTDPNVADPVKLAAIKDALDAADSPRRTPYRSKLGSPNPLRECSIRLSLAQEIPRSQPPWRLKARTPRQSNRTMTRLWASLTTTRSKTICRESNSNESRNPPRSAASLTESRWRSNWPPPAWPR